LSNTGLRFAASYTQVVSDIESAARGDGRGEAEAAAEAAASEVRDLEIALYHAAIYS
jgi:hypothetical protein